MWRTKEDEEAVLELPELRQICQECFKLQNIVTIERNLHTKQTLVRSFIESNTKILVKSVKTGRPKGCRAGLSILIDFVYRLLEECVLEWVELGELDSKRALVMAITKTKDVSLQATMILRVSKFVEDLADHEVIIGRSCTFVRNLIFYLAILMNNFACLLYSEEKEADGLAFLLKAVDISRTFNDHLYEDTVGSISVRSAWCSPTPT